MIEKKLKEDFGRDFLFTKLRGHNLKKHLNFQAKGLRLDRVLERFVNKREKNFLTKYYFDKCNLNGLILHFWRESLNAQDRVL